MTDLIHLAPENFDVGAIMEHVFALCGALAKRTHAKITLDFVQFPTINHRIRSDAIYQFPRFGNNKFAVFHRF